MSLSLVFKLDGFRGVLSKRQIAEDHVFYLSKFSFQLCMYHSLLFKPKISNIQNAFVSTDLMVQNSFITNNNHNIDADHMETRKYSKERVWPNVQCGNEHSLVTIANRHKISKISIKGA